MVYVILVCWFLCGFAIGYWMGQDNDDRPSFMG